MFKKDLIAEEVLLIAASIESHSNHPLAGAIVKYAKKELERDLLHPESIEDVVGWGVKAIIKDEEWKIGKAGFVGKEKVEQFADGMAKTLASEGKTVVFVQKG